MRLLLLLGLIATPAFAQTPITDASARAFVARQEQAWNAGRLDPYFAAFTAEARFTDQAYVGDKPPVPYGTSTLAEARAQARKALKTSKVHEASQVTAVQVAPDGRSARVSARVASTVDTAGKARRLCAARLQTLVVAQGRLLSRGQTDTFYKCPR